MRVLVCPQEFKGSLTAHEAARAIAAGVRAALPGVEVALLPLADGGPGTASVICEAAGGELVRMTASGPLGDPVAAAYALLAAEAGHGPRAVIEAATTAGLLLVEPDRRDPARASTFGVGEQVRAALARGVDEVIVGVGGTGTNDGGAGAAQALGYRLLDAAGHELPRGGLALLRLDHIDASGAEPRLREVAVRLAVDVTNPLLGPGGATAVYGPQKGVTPALAPQLEAALARWAEVLRRDLAVEVAALPGGGAGGGLAAGLAAVAGAHVESGAALVAEAVGLADAVARADLVITGEGHLDAQTAYGKTVAYVASVSRAAGRPCLAVAGQVEGLPSDIAHAEAAAPPGMPAEEAMARAAELVEAAAKRLVLRHARREASGP